MNRRRIIALFLSLVLAGCQQAPATFSPPAFAFERATVPTRVNVYAIRTSENYESLKRAPFIEHRFATTPSEATRLWVQRRLIENPSIGTRSVLEVNILEASVKEVKLSKTEGLKGLFTNDQEVRYDATLVVEFRLYSGASALSDASTTVTVTRNRTVAEHATVVEREAAYYTMLDQLMQDFDREANTKLRQYFTLKIM